MVVFYGRFSSFRRITLRSVPSGRCCFLGSLYALLSYVLHIIAKMSKYVHGLYWTKYTQNDTIKKEQVTNCPVQKFLLYCTLQKGVCDRMYINSAYLNRSLVDFKDKSRPLIVGSCGTYHLYTRPRLPTHRPRGRLDFQLLYIASGKAHFYFDNSETDTVVTAGQMVIYRPKEPQRYVYYGNEQTEVYWVHFTGSNVKNILRTYGIMDHMRVIPSGASLDYVRIFKQMIHELQRCQIHYPELLTLLLQQLFILLHRQLTQEHHRKDTYLNTEMELALQYFNDHYNTDISIEEYASSRGMSVSWFIRNFKQYTHSTPMQYLLERRMTNAQMLLETTNYNITEIGTIVGYDNPLYFSRIFRKQKGMSPSEYRRKGAADI